MITDTLFAADLARYDLQNAGGALYIQPAGNAPAAWRIVTQTETRVKKFETDDTGRRAVVDAARALGYSCAGSSDTGAATFYRTESEAAR